MEWKEFLDEYKMPPLNLPLHRPALSFGLAGPGTGVPFHFHGPGHSIYIRTVSLSFSYIFSGTFVSFLAGLAQKSSLLCILLV